jgi:hypothetical protein
MSEPSAMAALAQRLKVVIAGLVAHRARIHAAEPWPLAADFGPGPEASWGPRELLAHVAEMLPYWLGEVERVLGDGPEPVPFGRTQADPNRLTAIERDRTLPLAELYARIEAGAERYARRLPALTTADASRRGLHPVLGELPVTTILERMVVRHAEDHVRQLTDILAGPAAPTE